MTTSVVSWQLRRRRGLRVSRHVVNANETVWPQRRRWLEGWDRSNQEHDSRLQVQLRQSHNSTPTSSHNRCRNAWFTSSENPCGWPSGTLSRQPNIRAHWYLNRNRSPRGESLFLTPFFTDFRCNCRLSRSPMIWRVCVLDAAMDKHQCLTILRMEDNTIACWSMHYNGAAMKGSAHFLAWIILWRAKIELPVVREHLSRSNYGVKASNGQWSLQANQSTVRFATSYWVGELLLTKATTALWC